MLKKLKDNPDLRSLLKLPSVSDLMKPTEDSKGIARLGYIIIAITFGFFGLWAAFAPLDSSVHASGVLTNQAGRQTIQHLEGGIVRKIDVKEGDRVKAGQVLFELDPTQAQAGYAIARNQLLALLAAQARLEAERDNRSQITWPAELQNNADPAVVQAVADEQRQFFERRTSLQGQLDVLEAQRSQYKSEIEGIDRQSDGLKEQLVYIDDELGGLKQIYDKGLVPRPRLLALERERASLTGSIGRLIGDKAKTQQGYGEATLRLRQLRQEFYEKVSAEIAENQVKLTDIRQRSIVAADSLKRINLVSPVDGVAQNIRFLTVGAVVRPGEPVLEVAPDGEDLLIRAQFSVTDVDNIHAGMRTEVRLPSFHSRKMPVLRGTIESVSRDRLVDEGAKTAYYLAIVRVDDKDLPKQVASRITAGMPAEVIVPTGERTMLQYLLEPLTDTLRKTMREE
jgi:HlyD family type I secretion membrane fusion protein